MKELSFADLEVGALYRGKEPRKQWVLGYDDRRKIHE